MPETKLSCTAVCPFFVGTLDGGGKRRAYIDCEGLTTKQHVIALRFVDDAARDAWAYRFCCSMNRCKICPISRLITAAKYRKQGE